MSSRCGSLRIERTACANIAPLLIKVDELAQRLDDVDILPRPGDDQLTAFVQTIVQHLQALEHVPPVLALVVEAFVEHVHDLVEVGAAVESDAGNVGHVGAGRAPRVVGGSCRALSVGMFRRRRVSKAYHCGP